jgi:molybdopterin/thiamine biosynthesis adenylyltransferase
MADLNWSHQQKLFNPASAYPVTVLGAGSVGGFVVSMLAKLGTPMITVYDADDVRSHNLPMSVYRLKDLGRLKVEALKEIVGEGTGLEITTVPRMYEGEKLRSAVVTCVDTMEARGLAWRQARMNPMVGVFVDTRTHEHFVTVYTINPCDPEEADFYETQLFPTSEAKRPMCGAHGVVYMSSLAAASAVSALTRSWTGGKPLRKQSFLSGDARLYVYP